MYKKYEFLNKTVHFNQNPQTPTQKMPMALFATGSRQLYTFRFSHNERKATQIVNLIQITNKGEKR
jgi:hypothetical protein